MKDSNLIEKARRGSESAFSKLVEEYAPLVYSVARAVMGNHSMVDDVVQEVFIRVYTRLDTFRGDSKFSTWIYRIARNRALDSVHDMNRITDSNVDEIQLESREASPSRLCEMGELRSHLDELISGLSRNHRLVIELRYMGEKSYLEIAEIMDIPVGTVKTYLFRAKKELARMVALKDFSGGEGI